jgi:hypothetical protein
MIFDKDYMEYMRSKTDETILASSIVHDRTGQYSGQQAVAHRQKRLQTVQYECIKRKLKE